MARNPETLLLDDLVIRGETYPIREELKRHGFLFDPGRKEWRSGWIYGTRGPFEYEVPGRDVDGPAAERFVEALKRDRRGLDIQVGYPAAC